MLSPEQTLVICQDISLFWHDTLPQLPEGAERENANKLKRQSSQDTVDVMNFAGATDTNENFSSH